MRPFTRQIVSRLCLPASVLCLPSTLLLLIPDWTPADQELPLSRERCYSRLRHLPRTLHANGANPPAAVTAISLQAWAQPCLLGTQCMGYVLFL